MSIRVACTCGHTVEAAEDQRGRQVTCPKCGTPLTVQPPPFVEPAVLLQYADNETRSIAGLRPIDWAVGVGLAGVCLVLACVVVMPMMARSKRVTFPASCGSNIRQVTYGALAYANDWKEQLPTGVGIPDHKRAGLAHQARLPIIGFDTVSVWDWGTYQSASDGMNFLGGWAFVLRDYLKNDVDIMICPEGYATREDMFVRWDGSLVGSYRCKLYDHAGKVGYLWLPHRRPSPSTIIGNACNDGGGGAPAADKVADIAHTASDLPSLLMMSDWNHFGSRYYADCGVPAQTGCGLLANHYQGKMPAYRKVGVETGCMPQVFPPKIGTKEDAAQMPMGLNESRIDARSTWVPWQNWNYFKWGETRNSKDGYWHAW